MRDYFVAFMICGSVRRGIISYNMYFVLVHVFDEWNERTRTGGKERQRFVAVIGRTVVVNDE